MMLRQSVIFFSKLCRMENKSFVNKKAKFMQKSTDPIQIPTMMHETKNSPSVEC